MAKKKFYVVRSRPGKDDLAIASFGSKEAARDYAVRLLKDGNKFDDATLRVSDLDPNKALPLDRPSYFGEFRKKGGRIFDSSFPLNDSASKSKKGGTVRMARKTKQTEGRKRYVTGYSQDGYTHLTIYPVRNKKTKKNKK